MRISTVTCGLLLSTAALGGQLARPTPQQVAWQELEIGMFIHFAPNTYNNTQSDLGGASDPARFNPTKLDVEQWVSVAESMNARYIILVAKHVGGFCLWPTATTRYSIKSSPYKGGKGDIVGELTRASARRGIKFGLYVGPRDDHRGVGSGGKVRSGMPEDQARYDEIYKRQLTELLTGYGEIAEVWFDGGANGDLVGPLVRKHQPGAMIFQSSAATIRWVGNEHGVAPYPVWHTVTREAHLTGGPRGPDDPDGDVWVPAECDVPIRKDWFWTTDNLPSLKSLDNLMDINYKSVGRGCNLLLNHTPDRTGLIPEPDAARAAEFGAEIRRRFGKSLAEIRGEGDALELSLGGPKTVDHAITMEDIRHGQRVREYRIEAFSGGEWRTVVSGSSIGYKKIDRFTPVVTSRMRVIAVQSAATPKWRSFAAFSVDGE